MHTTYATHLPHHGHQPHKRLLRLLAIALYFASSSASPSPAVEEFTDASPSSPVQEFAETLTPPTPPNDSALKPRGASFPLETELLRQHHAPGIAKLATGYNIMTANPLASGIADPGYTTRPVFELAYTEGRRTPDDKQWKIPDKTYVDPTMSTCETSFSSTSMTGMQSYQSSLDDQVSISGGASGGFWSARFSASVDYKKTKKQTSTQHRVVVQSGAKCTAYAATIQLNDAPKLSSDFLTLAENLPDIYNLDDYVPLLTQFGTHLISGMKLGGRFGQRATFTTEAYTTMQKEKLDISAAAGFSAWFVSGDAKAMSSQEKEQAKSFSKESSDKATFNIGGSYSHDAEKWTQTVKENPMPVSLELKMLDQVFDVRYMPPKLAAKKGNVQKALRQYCDYLRTTGQVESCARLQPDKPLPIIPKITDMATDWNNNADEFNYHFLDRHNLVCPSDAGMLSFRLVFKNPNPNPNPNYHRSHYEYSCAEPSVGLQECKKYRTPTYNAAAVNGRDTYPRTMFQATVGESCRATNSFLTQYQLRSDGPPIHYDYTCCKAPSKPELTCHERETELTEAASKLNGNPRALFTPSGQDEWDYHYLDRQFVECKPGEALQDFRLIWPMYDKIGYRYRCCELPLQ